MARTGLGLGGGGGVTGGGGCIQETDAGKVHDTEIGLCSFSLDCLNMSEPVSSACSSGERFLV